MNILLTLLLSSLSFSAPRTFPVDAIKLIDGKIGRCSSEGDVGTLGYRPDLPLVLGGERSVKLSFNVYGLLCDSTEEGFAWKLRPINDPFLTKARDGQTVEHYVLKNEAVVTNEEFTKVYGTQTLANLGAQTVSLFLNLEDVLSGDQRRALNEGHSVAVRMRYFHRAKREHIYNGNRQLSRVSTGGAYRFTFTLVKEEGAIKVSAVTVL